MIPLVKVGMPDKAALMPALEKVLYSGMVGEGEAVYRFEDKFMQTFGLKHGLAFSSGTAALHTALHLAGVRFGDEVISTSMTAEPTNLAILHAGAKPVFADVEQDSGNISVDSIAEKITSKTKAIMIVHYAGIPVCMHALMALANKHHLPVIEDCAHALGAKYDGHSVGMLGDYGIFSFQAIKHMTTVDGGFLIVKESKNISEAKRFRWFGLEKGVPRDLVNVTSVGYKYNMNNVTATIGLAQLNITQKRIAIHKANGVYFDCELVKILGLSVPVFDAVAEPSYWLYTILSDNSDDIERKLKSIGVMASKLHRPNHYHSIFESSTLNLGSLDNYYKRMIHIPCGWWLTLEKRQEIVDVLRGG